MTGSGDNRKTQCHMTLVYCVVSQSYEFCIQTEELCITNDTLANSSKDWKQTAGEMLLVNHQLLKTTSTPEMLA